MSACVSDSQKPSALDALNNTIKYGARSRGSPDSKGSPACYVLVAPSLPCAGRLLRTTAWLEQDSGCACWWQVKLWSTCHTCMPYWVGLDKKRSVYFTGQPARQHGEPQICRQQDGGGGTHPQPGAGECGVSGGRQQGPADGRRVTPPAAHQRHVTDRRRRPWTHQAVVAQERPSAGFLDVGRQPSSECRRRCGWWWFGRRWRSDVWFD